MRIFIAWHAAVEPSYRMLFSELAELGADIRLLAPSSWIEAGRRQSCSGSPDAPFGTKAMSTIFTNHIRAFFYPNAPRVALGLLRFRPDVVHIMEEPFSLAAYELMRLKNIVVPKARSVLFSFENIDISQGFPYSVFQSYNVKNADSIIVVPVESKELWRKRGFEKNITQIPLGIDTGLFKRVTEREALKAAGIPSGGAFRLGYVGRVVREKGIGTVLESMKILKGRGRRCRLYIAGDGVYKEDILKTAGELGLSDDLRFLGAKDQSMLPAFYSSIDALILPSITTAVWKEQFGRVLPEAMACGTPVIGSSSGEIPGVIGASGLVFREKDAEDLCSCIERLIDEPCTRDEFIKKGLKKAAEEYSWRSVALRYLRLYETLLGTGKGSADQKTP